jgi:hypothetical protein
MGGRYLEDFKLVHARFDIRRLFSLEKEDIAHQRQEFNKPLALIKCLKRDTEAFVRDFGAFAGEQGDVGYVIWFDFTSPRERLSQLQEFQSLIAKLAANDVVKITLNASMATFGQASDFESRTAFQEHAAGRLKQLLGPYFPDEGIEATKLNDHLLAVTLSRSVRKAALQGVAGTSGLAVVPLCAFRYSDGPHQMLTLAAIILNEDERRRFQQQTHISRWPFHAKGWDDVRQISVPDLTVKERIRIDEALFADTIDHVHEALPFRLEDDDMESLSALMRYEEHYRRYPQFMRVTI